MCPDHSDKLAVQLDSFDPTVRREALAALVDGTGRDKLGEFKPETNLHCHTFYSFNAYGYSPSRFAWEARRYGLEVAGIVDFDVLDGVEEFLAAGRLLGLKTVAGFETRVFVPELEGKVTNSPNEPGVAYSITTGFVKKPEPGTPAARTLAQMADMAQRRNRRMAERVNAHLDPVTIDYDIDVLPLTPAGNATERHMLVAYEKRARETFSDRDALTRFWSERLGEPEDSVSVLLDDVVALKNLMRKRLMKYGGVGYTPPREGSFPQFEDVVRMTIESGALPNGGWLDGTHDGEEDTEALFRLWQNKGLPMVTIVPDRNWNLADPAEKALKVGRLNEAVETARRLDMPVIVGTEMNADGQKFVDTFSAPELAPHARTFLDGAHFAWGHTLLKATAGVGALDPWAREHFGEDLAARNEFFRRVGARAYPSDEEWRELSRLDAGAAPEEVLALLSVPSQ
jgi:hypothetical protein